MRRSPKRYYIKERQNPQLGVYYIACGHLPKTEARRKEKSTYGHNVMRSFDTEQEYMSEVERLRKAGTLAGL